MSLGPNPVVQTSEQTVVLRNRRGLHARASAALARLAGRMKSSIMVAKDGEAVTATSIMGLMMLGAACGDKITISAKGEDALAAMDEIIELIADRFGESE